VTTSSPGPEASPAGSALYASGGPAGPDDGIPGIPDALRLDRDDLDVLSLAGLAPPPDGDWLLVTSLESQPGGGFTAQHLHRHELRAHGGDVLVRVAPDTGSPGQPAVRAQVWAVMGGRLVLAGTWDRQSPDDWAEQVRSAVAFAMGMITELEESGADLGPLRLVRLDDPDAATVGVPFGITSRQATAPGRPAG
jgi:hypothetical protein